MQINAFSKLSAFFCIWLFLMEQNLLGNIITIYQGRFIVWIRPISFGEIKDISELLVLNNLLEDDLLVHILVLDILINYFVYLFLFVIKCQFDVVGECQSDKLLEKRALKIVVIYDFVNQILDEVFAILGILVALDDLRNEETSFNIVLHHVEEEINFWQEMPLTIPVLHANLKQKINNNLEQTFV